MGNFMMPCIENEVFKKNLFATLDTVGVGQHMERAVQKGRSSRPGIGHKLGLNYVSCSPFRVPIARLAAAPSAIEEKRAVKKKEAPR